MAAQQRITEIRFNRYSALTREDARRLADLAPGLDETPSDGNERRLDDWMRHVAAAIPGASLLTTDARSTTIAET